MTSFTVCISTTIKIGVNKTNMLLSTEISREEEPPQAYLVFAGWEPLAFTNLFPFWIHDENAQKNNDDVRFL